MNTEPLSRKSPRLFGFDYSASRYYFITICTEKHRCLFGKIVTTADNGKMILNQRGELIKKHICLLNNRYPNVSIPNYVIMPNHIHMILLPDNGNTVSVSQMIGQFKSGVSRELGSSVWQRSFYDHVIRNETDYKNIWKYIDDNPAKWAMDKYYISDV